MFNSQAEIKGPGSAEEAGGMKGVDVIVHTQPFLIAPPPTRSPRRGRGLFCERRHSETQRRSDRKQPEGEDRMQMRRMFTAARTGALFFSTGKFRRLV